MVKYYYLRDENGHPRVTVCLLKASIGGMFHRGLALCSYSEKVIDKKLGRKLAYKRAVKAMMSKRNQLPIKSPNGIGIVGDFFIYDFKSQYNVELTEFEQKLTKEKPLASI